MSFPTLENRPLEKNPNVLRAHEFLRQSNKLADRSLINAEGKQMLEKMLIKMVAEVQGQYALDEKKSELAKSGKILENLKTTYKTSMGVMEDRFVLADFGRKVQEKMLDINRNYSQCEHLRKATQSTNAEIRREKEIHEKRCADARKATGDLKSKSATISILLKNSTDVDQLRKIEEDKRVLEKEVEKLRAEKEYLAEDIKTKTATLKSEGRKSFHKTVIECAKNYTLYKNLTPKLLKSKQNLEKLREEEDSRRACGSLDETMQFDRSFVQASMEADRSPEKPVRSPPKDDRKSLKSPPMSNTFNESVQSVQENHTMDIEDVEERRNTSKNENTITISTGGNATAFIPAPVAIPVPQASKRTYNRHENIVETQKVVPREPSPEPAENHQEYDDRADLSVDLMEVDDGNDNVEPMEQEYQEEREQSPVLQQQLINDATVAVVPSQSSELTKSQRKAEVPNAAASEILDISNNGKNTNDIPMRLDEEEVMSENGSTRGNNFSFNFFTNHKATTGENSNGIESDPEGNFDFNFGSIGAGDDGSNSGSGGAFDFLNSGGDGEGPSSNNNVSDPFGFGSCAGGSGGGGDSSFNFNFGADNEGGNDAGAGGNSTSFFNF